MIHGWWDLGLTLDLNPSFEALGGRGALRRLRPSLCRSQFDVVVSCGCPYNQSPTVLGSISGPLNLGTCHVAVQASGGFGTDPIDSWTLGMLGKSSRSLTRGYIWTIWRTPIGGPTLGSSAESLEIWNC